MELMAKRFNELSLDEYHELLKLRCAVFLVEQQSPYQEVDDADKEAIHLYFRNDEGALAAYARVLPAGVTHPTASIGRVIAVERGRGMGQRIMEEAIRRPTPRAFTRSSVSCAPPMSSTTAASCTWR